MQSRLTIELDNTLEALVARHVEQNSREVLIILHDQYRAIALFHAIAIVGNYGLRNRSALGLILERVAHRLSTLVLSSRSARGSRRTCRRAN